MKVESAVKGIRGVLECMACEVDPSAPLHACYRSFSRGLLTPENERLYTVLMCLFLDRGDFRSCTGKRG